MLHYCIYIYIYIHILIIFYYDEVDWIGVEEKKGDW